MQNWRSALERSALVIVVVSGATSESSRVSVGAAQRAILICEGSDVANFVGPRAQLIATAEAALGFALPPSYRLFVERLGAGSVGSFEVYGLIREPFQGPIPDAVWVTLSDRDGPSRLPNTMLVIGADGMGGDYVLDVSKSPEPPVEVWEGGISVEGDRLERVADSFGAFLLDNVERATGS